MATDHWILGRDSGLITCKGPEITHPVEVMRVSDHERIVADLEAKARKDQASMLGGQA